eukprot:GHVL01044221.1.p2 GENE.GHVL01044221.1~~GHVL01044221.1.p2  ORF type:complete len:398 (+),score=68.68 GHVL01044221.1:54-1247(+)
MYGLLLLYVLGCSFQNALSDANVGVAVEYDSVSNQNIGYANRPASEGVGIATQLPLQPGEHFAGDSSEFATQLPLQPGEHEAGFATQLPLIPGEHQAGVATQLPSSRASATQIPSNSAYYSAGGATQPPVQPGFRGSPTQLPAQPGQHATQLPLQPGQHATQMPAGQQNPHATQLPLQPGQHATQMPAGQQNPHATQLPLQPGQHRAGAEPQQLGPATQVPLKGGFVTQLPLYPGQGGPAADGPHHYAPQQIPLKPGEHLVHDTVVDYTEMCCDECIEIEGMKRMKCFADCQKNSDCVSFQECLSWGDASAQGVHRYGCLIAQEECSLGTFSSDDMLIQESQCYDVAVGKCIATIQTSYGPHLCDGYQKAKARNATEILECWRTTYAATIRTACGRE